MHRTSSERLDIGRIREILGQVCAAGGTYLTILTVLYFLVVLKAMMNQGTKRTPLYRTARPVIVFNEEETSLDRCVHSRV